MKIEFSESNSFYKNLDSQIEKGKVTVLFKNERPNENSKLWSRLRRCKNWSVIENELEKVKYGKESKIKKLISPSMRACLTGGELILVAWIATLIAGLISYGIYNKCRIKLKISIIGSDVELEINPEF